MKDTQTILEFLNVTKKYRGIELPVLLDVNLRIQQGEFVAIMGPSGSGKSTLLHLAGLLDRPTDGKLVFLDLEVGRASDRQLTLLRNQNIGFVFQSFHLLPRMSVRRNISLPLLYTRGAGRGGRKLVDHAMQQVGLQEFAQRKPTSLSGGQRQKTAIARAIVNGPSLLLADEPTGNLDSHSRAEVLEIFRNLHQQGTTVVLVTHDPQVAAIAERVLHMRDGRICDSQ